MDYQIRKAEFRDTEDMLNILKVWNMHHIPSPEVEDLDLSCFFVALFSGKIIGLSGYKVLSSKQGKTTLMAILPEFQGHDIGKKLQDIRLEAMHKAGVETITTNADDIRTIAWYKKHYNYRTVGKLKKLCSFGLEHVDHWTTIEMDLNSYYKNRQTMEEKKNTYIQENDPPPLSTYPPLIINVCLTGMMPTKTLTHHVPVSVDEIIEDAIKVYDAGARIVHLHARDADGVPVSDARYYEDIISGIRREREDMICCTTTSGRNISDISQRTEVLYLTGSAKPDMASLTLGSLNFLTGASVNSIETVEHLALTMKENDIKPELEVFDYGMINLAKYLERHDIISGKKYFNILLGNLNTAPATLTSLSMMTENLPQNSLWAATGIGSFQLPINVTAIASGGHVRVGLEDSIYFDYQESILATNEDLVKRVARIAEELQRPIATPDEARSMIGLL